MGKLGGMRSISNHRLIGMLRLLTWFTLVGIQNWWKCYMMDDRTIKNG